MTVRELCEKTVSEIQITFDDDPISGNVDVIIPLSAEPLEILGERVLNTEVNLIQARMGVLTISTNSRKHLMNEIPKVDVNMKWTLCSQELPDKEVLCCDIHNNIMLGYVFVDIKSDSGFSAENENCFMYECVAWMPKPKWYMEVNDA